MPNSIRRIQLYGERCSGTNYLNQLLYNNFPNIPIVQTFGGKHFHYQGSVEYADDCLFIVIYRNPFVWLQSFCRTPHHAALELRDIPFNQFLQKEWYSIWDEKADVFPDDPLYRKEIQEDRDPDTQQRYANVLMMRAGKIRNWQSLKQRVKHFLFVQYENLYANPIQFIDQIACQFQLEKSTSFVDVTSRRGKGQKAFVPRAYRPINGRDVHYIVENLDMAIEDGIGYNINVLAIEQLRYNTLHFVGAKLRYVLGHMKANLIVDPQTSR